MKQIASVVVASVVSSLCVLGVLGMMGMQLVGQPPQQAQPDASPLPKHIADAIKNFDRGQFAKLEADAKKLEDACDSLSNAYATIPRPSVCGAPSGGYFLIITGTGQAFVVSADTAVCRLVTDLDDTGYRRKWNAITGSNADAMADYQLWKRAKDNPRSDAK